MKKWDQELDCLKGDMQKKGRAKILKIYVDVWILLEKRDFFLFWLGITR